MAKKRTVKRKDVSSLDFNHAMIYTARFRRSLAFYHEVLGFEVIDLYPSAYARLKRPGGRGTIALHAVEPGQRIEPEREGIRLYFEVRGLDAFCKALAKRRVRFDRLPEDMPWGWRHAYLRDPDGHELSLYWAGRSRPRGQGAWRE